MKREISHSLNEALFIVALLISSITMFLIAETTPSQRATPPAAEQVIQDN